MTKSLDQSGGSEEARFGTSNGDGGRKAAEHRADQARQDAQVNDLAKRAVGAASGGGVPEPMKRKG